MTFARSETQRVWYTASLQPHCMLDMVGMLHGHNACADIAESNTATRLYCAAPPFSRCSSVHLNAYQIAPELCSNSYLKQWIHQSSDFDVKL